MDFYSATLPQILKNKYSIQNPTPHFLLSSSSSPTKPCFFRFAMEFLPLDLTKTSSLTLVGNGENGTEKKLEEKDLLRRLGEHHGQFSGNGSVDCTLSLGFPSGGESSRKEGYCSKSTVAVSPQPWTRLKEVLGFNVKPMQGGAVVLKKGGHAGISTFVRRCSACETTQTPLWRNGPNGAKSLCNACGIRFKKEERRVTMMNGLANSQAKPKGGGHGKSPQEMLRSSKKPKFHIHLNSSPQL